MEGEKVGGLLDAGGVWVRRRRQVKPKTEQH
jgi:hypothetical protein